MSLSNAQLAVLKARKAAAKSALRFFTDIKSVKSVNNPFASTTSTDLENLIGYRHDRTTYNSISQDIENAAHYQVGNCDEKARICYASLKSNPRIGAGAGVNGSSQVSLCTAVGYDHVFVVVSNLLVQAPMRLSALPATAMIVDGWTEDWYFPQLPWTTAKWYGLGNTPNPRQLYVRNKIASHRFQGYGYGKGGPPPDVSEIVSRLGQTGWDIYEYDNGKIAYSEPVR